MNTCPLTYETITQPQVYSSKGLRRLSAGLTHLNPFPYTAQEQRKQAQLLSSKMSIQGVQPKLSAVLSIAKEQFVIVDRGGRYILKPQVLQWQHLPENEDLTMRLAQTIGIETPLHGLIYAKDGSKTYFIRRYDRKGQKGKVHAEDFAQLSGQSRDTKYASSMEKVADIIEHYCTFPVVDKRKLLRRTLFSFIVGNEDMHLKNFSLIVRNGKTELSPAYDLVNSCIVIETPKKELALPIRGKKNKLTKEDLLTYYGQDQLGLNESVCVDICKTFEQALPTWHMLINRSFLPQKQKQQYRDIVENRYNRLGIKISRAG